ncbi:hypothetical protein HanPSC8_Chr15g0683141 [Helianthus annuus]|nr:hypothetical protein HanPSC8_Chr15g0683141 [Helianthus annuus]
MLGSVHDTVGLSELSFGFDLVRSSLGWVMVLAWFKFRGAARIHSGQFRVSVKGSQQSQTSQHVRLTGQRGPRVQLCQI